MRLLWDFAKNPDNIKAARDRVSKGELLSDLYRKPPQSSASSANGVSWVSAGMRRPYPIELAQRNYIQLHGNKAFSRAVMAMITKTLS
jgi:hypothetical protein